MNSPTLRIIESKYKMWHHRSNNYHEHLTEGQHSTSTKHLTKIHYTRKNGSDIRAGAGTNLRGGDVGGRVTRKTWRGPVPATTDGPAASGAVYCSFIIQRNERWMMLEEDADHSFNAVLLCLFLKIITVQ
jgi:hypothetical protein